MMMDFINFGNRDPLVYALYKKASYFDFITKIETSLTNKFSNILNKYKCNIDSLKQDIKVMYGYILTDSVVNAAIRNINGDFLMKSDRRKYTIYNSLERINGNIVFSNTVQRLL